MDRRSQIVFDDQQGNIDDVSSIGVVSVLTPNGVEMKHLRGGPGDVCGQQGPVSDQPHSRAIGVLGTVLFVAAAVSLQRLKPGYTRGPERSIQKTQSKDWLQRARSPVESYMYRLIL